MWPFTRRLDELAEDDLRALIAAGIREGTSLEFKREMYQRRNPEQTREMLRDITAMANAEGGVLILGMAEDGRGTAQQLVPVPDAAAEADRLIQLCLAHISERIPGLRAVRVPVTSGEVIVVRIPRSYRRPHMVTFDGVTELWIRHDRQKSRMSVAELRTAVLATEDAEMRAERFGASRIANARQRSAVFMLAATPLLLEDGRVTIDDERVARLLRQPPAIRPQAAGAVLALPGCEVQPTLRGLAAVSRGVQELEVFRNGHVDFLLFEDRHLFARRQGLPRSLVGWVVAEYMVNFLLLIAELRNITEIADPYVIRVALFNVRGVTMTERGVDPSGLAGVLARANEWSESDHLTPIGE